MSDQLCVRLESGAEFVFTCDLATHASRIVVDLETYTVIYLFEDSGRFGFWGSWQDHAINGREATKQEKRQAALGHAQFIAHEKRPIGYSGITWFHKEV